MRRPCSISRPSASSTPVSGTPPSPRWKRRIASLEGGRGATCAASGHAAQVLAFFPLLEAGERFAASNRLYGGSVTQFSRTFPKFDWRCDFVDTEDLSAVEAVLAQGAKALFVESLANPGGVVTDLEALAGPDSGRGRRADRRQHTGHALALPTLRVGRRSGCPFGDEVPLRHRYGDRRRRGGQRPVRLDGVGALPPACPGRSRPTMA